MKCLAIRSEGVGKTREVLVERNEEFGWRGMAIIPVGYAPHLANLHKYCDSLICGVLHTFVFDTTIRIQYTEAPRNIRNVGSNIIGRFAGLCNLYRFPFLLVSSVGWLFSKPSMEILEFSGLNEIR